MSVSVIIPVYNRAQLLQRALESVLQQTRVPEEIIVIDDGSDDDVKLCVDDIREKIKQDDIQQQSCKGKNTELVFISIVHCGMAGKVRNIGIMRAQGTIITFLDSDDTWEKEKIALQLPYMNTHGLCHTREKWMRNNKEVSQKSQKHQREGDIFSHALQKCIIGPSTVMLQKNVFTKYGLFREDLQIAEDYEFWLRITAKEKVAYIDRPLVIKYDLADGLQLSKKYSYIERFRIDALEPLVKKNIFSRDQQKLAQQMLEQKQKIWNKGAEKRK